MPSMPAAGHPWKTARFSMIAATRAARSQIVEVGVGGAALDVVDLARGSP